MKVELLQHTSLETCAHAIRTAWQSFERSDNGGENDLALIYKIGNKFKHSSTLEHLVYTFYIQEVSRAVLQELARHRIASPTVKSTRYTLKELKGEVKFNLQLIPKISSDLYESKEMKRAGKYLVWTGNIDVDEASFLALENLRKILKSGVSNDRAKYCLPESYKTELTWTINARSLQNFLQLRSSKAALWEIRDLAFSIYNALPESHKYLFSDSLTGG